MVLETCGIVRNVIIKLLKQLSIAEVTFEKFIQNMLEKKFTY